MDLPLFYNINILIHSQDNDKDKINKTIKSIKNQQYLHYNYNIINDINGIKKIRDCNANDLIFILNAGDVLTRNKIFYNLNMDYLNSKFYSRICSLDPESYNTLANDKEVYYNFRLLYRAGLNNFIDMEKFNDFSCFYNFVFNFAVYLNLMVGKQVIKKCSLDYQNIKFKLQKKKYNVKKIAFPTQLILATYKRNYYINLVLNGLMNQSYKNFALTIIDNNEDRNSHAELDKIIKKYEKTLNIKLIRDNFNYHCMSRFYFARTSVMKENIVDNIIIFDDDRIFERDWIKKMINEFRPLTIHSWYLKNFSVIDYWKGRSGGNMFKYFGPGGSIIDSSFLLYNPLFGFNEYDINAIKIDDIWGSFVFNRFLGINFLRSSLKNPIALNVKYKKQHGNKIYNTFSDIKQLKNVMFKNLSSKYGWLITEKQNKAITVNNYFSHVYLLEENKKLIEQLKQNNIVASVKGIDEIITLHKNKNNKILVFPKDIMLTENFIHIFDSYAKNNKIKMCLETYDKNNNILMLRHPLIKKIYIPPKVCIYLTHPNLNDFKINKNFILINDNYKGDGIVIYINNHPNNIFDDNIIHKCIESYITKKKLNLLEIKINNNIRYDTIMKYYFPYYYQSTKSNHISLYDSVEVFNKIKKKLVRTSPFRTFIYNN